MKRSSLIHLALSVMILAVGTATVRAQSPGPEETWASWWYGIYGGANFNMFSGSFESGLTGGTSEQTMFDAGSGLGLALGGVLEYNPGDLFGFNLMVGYDNRAVTHDQVAIDGATADLSTGLAYLTIEPNLRVNLGSRFLHLLVGPSFGINVAKSFESEISTGGTPVATSGDMQNVRSFVIGAQGGVGYDIPLAGADANTQILLTPFAQFRIGLQDFIEPPEGSTDEYKMNTVRGGLQLKFGSRPASMPAPLPESEVATQFSVRAPSVITTSRKLYETFPMRNYVFFDAGSTDIPARYNRLSSSQANDFREEQLLQPLAEAGGNDAMKLRSNQQMQVYYQILNIYGDRLRRNPSATAKLIGAANGDAAAGKQMAQKVKDYLVSTFGIDAGRLTVEGQKMPTNKSGSGSSRGEDKEMIAAENYRVDIVTTPEDLMKPLNIVTMQEEPIGNDVVISMQCSECEDEVAFWNVEITERGGQTRTFGPYRDIDNNTSVLRLDANDLLDQSRQEARYTAKMTATLKNGKIGAAQQEFRLVRADADEEQTGNRYSILFEFDESKTVQTYEKFLSETVAPNIPDGSSVIIHGYTDVIGDPEYNRKLSQKRAEETQRILTGELTKAGKTVTFDTYGFGEDERRVPFNNVRPEQRYYNRTVVVEVIAER